MAAASFLTTRATLFGRARAPPGAREFARTPCAVARADSSRATKRRHDSRRALPGRASGP